MVVIAVNALSVFSGLCCLPKPALADDFQRIRTFDPARGLVPGNGAQSAPATQPYNTPTNGGASSEADDASASDEQASHHKHHHKFLFFGHHEDNTQSAVTDANDANNTRSATNSTRSTNQSNTNSLNSTNSLNNANNPNNSSNNLNKTGKTAAITRPAIRPANRSVYSGTGAGVGPATTTNNSANWRRPQINQDDSIPTPGASPPAAETTASIGLPTVLQHGASPVTPPDAPTRPQSPAVDQSARLPNVQNAGAKPALAWRARAWKLALEQDDAALASKHPSKILNCSIEDALAAVSECCKAKGAQIIGQSLPAGQLGARFGDNAGGRALVVFVAKSIGTNRTLLKASADSARAQKIALVNDLILQAAAIIDGKGVL